MKFGKLIIFTLIATIIIDVFRYLSYVDALSVDNSSYISSILSYVSLLIIAYYSVKFSKKNEIVITNKILFKFWLYWLLISLLRGGFIADDYWDWKYLMLTSLPFTLISLVFYIGNNLFYFRKIFNFFLKYVFLFGFALIPLTFITNEELYSRIMIPVSIFILFIPFVKTREKLLILVVTIVSVGIAIGFRSHLIKVAFSILFLSLYYLPKIIWPGLIKVVHKILFVLPITLLVLGITNSYNIFSDIENIEASSTDQQGEDINMSVDTRTFLYAEVLSDMDTPTNWLIGKSASGSFHSNFFYDSGGSMKGKRYRSEVNILNILLYHGLIGVLLYLVLLYKVSYWAITKSKNTLGKMLGLLIASRWLLSFVEEFTQYDLNFYFFWLIVGLVSSRMFLEMSNADLKNYFKNNGAIYSCSSNLSQQESEDFAVPRSTL